jgi:serine/threonine-protein kinase
VAGWVFSQPPAAPAHGDRIVVNTPPGTSLALAAFTQTSIALSPDGTRVMFRTLGKSADAANSVWWIRDRNQWEPSIVPGAEGGAGVVFSPDGASIAFYQNNTGALMRMPVGGGAPTTICLLKGQLRGASWAADGTIVFASDGVKGLQRVSAAGGEPQLLTTPKDTDPSQWQPDVLPDGQGILFSAVNGGAPSVAVLAPDGQVAVLVAGGTQPRYAASGHLLYVQHGTLFAAAFDPRRRVLTGEAVPVVEGVAMTNVGAANYDLAADGSLVYATGGDGGVGKRSLVWVDRQGRQEPVNAPPRAYTYARLSPDGNRVALDVRDQQNDIWIWDLQRESLQRLTTDPGLNRLPVWSPDGRKVAYSAERDGQPESIYWQSADGSGTPERLSVGSSSEGPDGFSPDGKFLIFTAPLTRPFDIGVISLQGQRSTERLLASPFSESNGQLSPDGKWIAYESDESGRPEIYVRPFPDVNASKQVASVGGGTRALWSRDGRELFYYVSPPAIMSVPVSTGGAGLILGKPGVAVKGAFAAPLNAGRHYDVSPDGKRFLLLKDVEEATTGEASQIRLITNFMAELKRIVPVK